MTTSNAPLLDEVNGAGLWFHARKTRPIHARVLEAETVIPTREGETRASAGDVLCRGEAGDVWPQSAERLNAKYEATDEIDEEGWRKYVPHPDAQGVMAAQIDHPFEVTASWGALRGQPGDYLVKNYEDREVDDPADVWVVGGELFRATYEGVEN